MTTISTKKNSFKVRIYLDILFFILMVLVLIPQTTGIPIHEWVSLIILIPFLLHLIINWDWIATNSTKFLKKETNKTRLDYVLNWLLYLVMLIVMVSGIVISESALPLFGIHFEPDRFWSKIHDVSATFLMVVLGVHIALHWIWIVGAFRKLKFKADFHHLTEIKRITKKYAKQLLFIIIVSIVLSLIIWVFDFSEWADGFRINSNSHGGGKHKTMPQSWMIYLMPLLKITMVITIPALITGAILRLKKLARRKYSTKRNIKAE